MLYQLTDEAVRAETKLEYRIVIEKFYRAKCFLFTHPTPLTFAIVQIPGGLYFGHAMSMNFEKIDVP